MKKNKKMDAKIKLYDKDKTFLRLAKNISYVLFEKGQCWVYFKDFKRHKCSMCLADILKLFPGLGLHFIHQSKLINVNDIAKNIRYNPLLVTMRDGSKHKVSFRKQRYFIQIKISKWIDLGQ